MLLRLRGIECRQARTWIPACMHACLNAPGYVLTSLFSVGHIYFRSTRGLAGQPRSSHAASPRCFAFQYFKRTSWCVNMYIFAYIIFFNHACADGFFSVSFRFVSCASILNGLAGDKMSSCICSFDTITRSLTHIILQQPHHLHPQSSLLPCRLV
jgi:hypothetical protein